MMAHKGYRRAKFADRWADPVGLQVTANIGGKVVVTTNYELFLSEMIKAGIKGNTQARKARVGLPDCGDGARGVPEGR
jgi:hypothetical protein